MNYPRLRGHLPRLQPAHPGAGPERDRRGRLPARGPEPRPHRRRDHVHMHWRALQRRMCVQGVGANVPALPVGSDLFVLVNKVFYSASNDALFTRTNG